MSSKSIYEGLSMKQRVVLWVIRRLCWLVRLMYSTAALLDRVVEPLSSRNRL